MVRGRTAEAGEFTLTPSICSNDPFLLLSKQAN